MYSSHVIPTNLFILCVFHDMDNQKFVFVLEIKIITILLKENGLLIHVAMLTSLKFSKLISQWKVDSSV